MPYLSDAIQFNEITSLMCMELNAVSINLTKYDWLTVLQTWVEYVQNQYNEYLKTRYVIYFIKQFLNIHFICRKPTNFSFQDKLLVKHLKEENLYVSFN